MDEIDKLLAGIEQPARSAPPAIDDLLSQVKVDQTQPIQGQSVQEDQKNKRLHQLKIQRQELSRSNATKWLAKLSSVSEEGRWFEEFACHYESRLEAALDYLEAIEEAKSSNQG
jgi:hypothetical protein